MPDTMTGQTTAERSTCCRLDGEKTQKPPTHLARVGFCVWSRNYFVIAMRRGWVPA